MEDLNLGEIYKITNLINNKIYIGKTKTFYLYQEAIKYKNSIFELK